MSRSPTLATVRGRLRDKADAPVCGSGSPTMDCLIGTVARGRGSMVEDRQGRDGGSRNRAGVVLLIISCMAIALSAWPAVAAVSDTEEFSRFGERGSGEGNTAIVEPMGTSSISGNVFVPDLGNQRLGIFSPWGVFIKAIGWGVATGATEFQECTTSCQAGIAGEGIGQFQNPTGAVVSSTGDVYVYDWGNQRVQKFDEEGHFLLM